MLYDLHSHSSASDGILSPAALVSRASANNVSVLALTDHDTVAGIHEARAQAERENLQLIAGIEFSSQWQGRSIHIVGLDIDPDSAALQGAVAQQAAVRTRRAERIAAKLERLGFAGALAAAQGFAGDAVIGRPHFARFLVEAGHVKNTEQAFKKYLGAGKAGDIKQDWPDFEQVIAWIHQAGGLAVLAHPCKYKMTRSKLCAMVQAFADLGGDALEVVSGPQSPNQTRDMLGIAVKFGLKVSCGSDFHQPGQVWQELGKFASLPEDVDGIWQNFRANRIGVL